MCGFFLNLWSPIVTHYIKCSTISIPTLSLFLQMFVFVLSRLTFYKEISLNCDTCSVAHVLCFFRLILLRSFCTFLTNLQLKFSTMTISLSRNTLSLFLKCLLLSYWGFFLILLTNLHGNFPTFRWTVMHYSFVLWMFVVFLLPLSNPQD